MTTFDDLPAEIVSFILRIVLDSNEEDIHHKYQNRLNATCQLSLVSRQFYEIVWEEQREVDFTKIRKFRRSRVANLALYSVISKSHHVESVMLGDCLKISDNALKHIGSIVGPRLKRISLNNCGQSITSQGISYMISRCKNIMEIDLSTFYSDIIDDEIIRQLCENCTNMESITVKSAACTDLIFFYLTNLKNLKSVNISGCTNLTARGLGRMMSSMPSIRSLDISSNPKMLNNEALSQEANLFSWFGLDSLSLSNSMGVNDETINLLLPHFMGLQKMDLNRTDVSQTGITRLCRRLLHLQTLDMRHLPRIYPKFLYELLETYPSLKWSHFYAGRLTTSDRLQEEKDNERRNRLQMRRAERGRSRSFDCR